VPPMAPSRGKSSEPPRSDHTALAARRSSTRGANLARVSRQGGDTMLGEKIYEITGKVTGTRVIPHEGSGVGIEVSFQGTGKLLGAEVTEIGSYESMMRASGSLYGQGQGIAIGKQGEMAHWKGFGVGRPTGKGLGAVYRYAVTYETASEK